MTNIHVDSVSVLIDDSFLPFADADDATTAALGPSEKTGEQESDDVEDDIEEIWNVSRLCRTAERDTSTIQLVDSLWEFLALPVLATAVKAQ